MSLNVWSSEIQEYKVMPNTSTVEPFQLCISRENKDCFTQVRIILKYKLHVVVDEDQEGSGKYTGECMKGFAHGEGTIKFNSGNEVKAFGYYGSRLGRYL